MLAHNGEINTLKRQRQLDEEPRDRAWRAGASATHRRRHQAGDPAGRLGLRRARHRVRGAGRAPAAPRRWSSRMLMPEAWSKPRRRCRRRTSDLYSYCNCGDGAVGRPGRDLRHADGRWVSPAWTATACGRCATRVTDDGLLIVGSETGMVPLAESDDRREGPRRPRPDDRGRSRRRPASTTTREIKDQLAAEQPYGDWVENITDLDELSTAARPSRAALRARRAAPPPGRRRPHHGGSGADPPADGRGRQGSRSARWATTRRSRCSRTSIAACSATSSGRTSARSPTRRSTACARSG